MRKAVAVLLLACSVQAAPIGFYERTPGRLVGWWTFNEGTGTASTADLSGFNNVAYLTNSPGWITGVIRYGLSFNGSSQLVNVPTNSLFSFDKTNGFTLSAWVKTTSAAALTYGVVCKYAETPAFAGYFMAVNSGTVYFQIASDNAKYKYRIGGTTVTNGAWHLIAATSDGTGTTNGLSLFVDGVQDLGGSAAEAGILGSIITNVPVRIGNRSLFFNGSIDDVRIYSTNLTAAQIKRLYNSGSGNQH